MSLEKMWKIYFYLQAPCKDKGSVEIFLIVRGRHALYLKCVVCASLKRELSTPPLKVLYAIHNPPHLHTSTDGLARFRFPREVVNNK